MEQSPIHVMAALIGGVFIIYKHSSNIGRLRAESENVFTFGARKP
jgi:glycerol-3-phosphate acyltransferase PlsY